MKPVLFEGHTHILNKPDSMSHEECGSLPVKITDAQPKYESVWELTDEEIEQIKASKRIRLIVTSAAHPPVFMEVVS